MWLFTLTEWTCTRCAYLKADIRDVEEKTRSKFCKCSDPNDGLRLLAEYADRFNNRPVKTERRFVVEYRLLSMVRLPDDTNIKYLDALNVEEISQSIVDSINEP